VLVGTVVGVGVAVLVGTVVGMGVAVLVAVEVLVGTVTSNEAEGWLLWPSLAMMLCWPIDADPGIVKMQPLFTSPALSVPQLELSTRPRRSTSK